MSKRKFTWDSWDYDFDGNAYVIAKDECPNRENVPRYIVSQDHLHDDVLNPELGDCLKAEDVKEGWCKWQVRTDWADNDDYTPRGAYVVEDYEPNTKNIYGKRKPGWFAVWLVRKGAWY